MAGIDFRSQRALAVATALTVIVALLPTGWLAWTAVLATILRVPVQPMAQGGVHVGQWLRSPAEIPGESEALRARTEELETTRALLHRARLQIEGLQEQIEVLQEVQGLWPGVQITPIFARVTRRAPDRAHGPIRINAGSRHGIVAGAIVVYRGGHLIGRVAEGVSRLSSGVVPITDAATGFIEGIVLPAGDPVTDVRTTPHIQLVPDDHGGLVGDLDRETPMHTGDVVRLADPSWPDSAQGLIIGMVDTVEPKDLQPLLNTVTVRPRFKARRVASVTVIIEHFADRSGGPP